MTTYRQCTRCIFDTSIPGVSFDEKGECNFCKIHDVLDKIYPLSNDGKQQFDKLIEKIKRDGKNKKYDCVVGVSGGRDSTYTLYLAKKLGLRPLAVHFDNGWNSTIAVTNIKNIVSKLGVDLYTTVADWEEFKSLQLSFLKASVSDAEIPTDVAIFGTLHKAAAENDIRYIINGHSFRTEGVVPIGWTYMDGRYINEVHRKFDGRSLKSIPNFTLWDMVYYTFIKRIKVIPMLNYFNYLHEETNKILEEEVGWQYYGGHHHESSYTQFFQSYYLPEKFKIDKRLLEFSALIRSGQISREYALDEMKKEYHFSEDLVEYVKKKLELSDEDFREILTAENKSFKDFPTYYPLIRLMKTPVRIATSLGLLEPIIYYKYFS